MEERRVPNLEEMDEQQALALFEELASELSPEKEHALRHADYVMEMPQSGERIRGPENMRAFQEGFPSNSSLPNIRIRRVLIGDRLWVVESVVDYGGQVMCGAAILELRDGKIWRDTRYFSEPFEAPEWRSQWVERIEP